MKRFPNIMMVIRVYILSLIVFFLFRLVLFISESSRINLEEDAISTILQAFIMGVRFDVVIIGYIMIIPALLLAILDIFNKQYKYIIVICFYWTLIFLGIAFTICAADIPYFNHFFSRFSIGAFEWIENTDIVVNMILQEPKYFAIIFPFIIGIIVFYRYLKRIFQKKTKFQKTPIITKVLVSLLFLGVVFIGIRGRVTKMSPIRIGTAYFSNNAFLNQLGLNPVFTLMRSYIDSKNPNNTKVNEMDSKVAMAHVRNSLELIENGNNNLDRKISFDSSLQQKPNVVIIIMESMSAAKMSRYGNKNNLTPFLDSLSKVSYNFENVYTAGKHTFNGIFSTLFSFPALYRQHPMKTINKFEGISYQLKNQGYSTTYFTTHDGQFDNVEGFLYANDFERIYSQSDYPSEEIKNALGVPDDYLFRYSIPVIDNLHKKNKPFFVNFMTISDHGPFFVPEYFESNQTSAKKQATEYADWSLRKFLNMAKKKPWFDNTIFVFVADHGAPITASYDISLDYHHSPLVIYSPLLKDMPKNFDCIGGQIDVYPTIMGLLKVPYTNNTLGIDLLSQKRPYIIVNDDNKIGVLDHEYFLIMRKGSPSKLYKYQNSDKNDYASIMPDKVLNMETYAKSQMQVYQDILNKKQ